LPPYLSIIIPAFNERRRLPDTLSQVLAFLAAQTYPAEVIVVDNGSTDGTSEVVLDAARRNPGVRLVRDERRGKGLATRLGMRAAQGEYRFLCDADLSMPIDQVSRFLPPQVTDVDIVIGSREAPGSMRIGEPPHRHWIGRGFNTLVRLLAVPDIHDTQCGFKCFRGTVAEDLFSVQRLDGWTFDVEVLFVARRRGYRMVELPIPWSYRPGSRVRPVRDSLLMFFDLIRIRLHDWQGRYAPPGVG
jgi:dolichyl-phosphate beta-glucosyltransferase